MSASTGMLNGVPSGNTPSAATSPTLPIFSSSWSICRRVNPAA
jgi:hypothetical protein